MRGKRKKRKGKGGANINNENIIEQKFYTETSPMKQIRLANGKKDQWKPRARRLTTNAKQAIESRAKKWVGSIISCHGINWEVTYFNSRTRTFQLTTFSSHNGLPETRHETYEYVASIIGTEDDLALEHDYYRPTLPSDNEEDPLCLPDISTTSTANASKDKELEDLRDEDELVEFLSGIKAAPHAG